MKNEIIKIYKSDYITAMSNMTSSDLKKTNYLMLGDRWKMEWDDPVQVY